MKLLLTAFFALVFTVALTACGTTKHFYESSDCEKIEGGYICER